jgi:hypothetical protein
VRKVAAKRARGATVLYRLPRNVLQLEHGVITRINLLDVGLPRECRLDDPFQHGRECARVTKQHLQCAVSHAVSGQWELVACSAQCATCTTVSGQWALVAMGMDTGTV